MIHSWVLNVKMGIPYYNMNTMKKIAIAAVLTILIFIPKIAFAVAQNIKLPQKVKIIIRQ